MAVKLLLLFVLLHNVASEEATQGIIGGIFYEDAEDMKAAFMESAKKFNFTASMKEVTNRGQMLVIKEYICQLAEEGVLGIIDGIGGRASEIIQALCDTLELPHVVVQHSDWYSKDWSFLNMYPSPAAYNMVLEELIELKDWKNFTLIYVKGFSMTRMNNLMMMGKDTDPFTVAVREVSENDYREVLINAKENGYTNFVVDCPSRYLELFLTHAQQVGLMADEHSYIIISPDLYTLDLSRHRYGGVNMTGFRLMEIRNNEALHNFTQQLNSNEIITNPMAPEEIKTRVLLIHDAFKVFAEALKKVIVEPTTLSCDNSDSWSYGSSLLNFMKTNNIEGLTRTLVFDGYGQRNDVELDIIELIPAGNQKIGYWNFDKLDLMRPLTPNVEIGEESPLKNKTLKVLIAKTPPYVYIKESWKQMEGNDRFEGFAIDLIINLAQTLGFNYEFELEPNNDYGSFNDKTNESTGMVLQLREEKADLAICDLTMTVERQAGIDFSQPFMNLGIGILYKEPSKQPPEMFSFMAVFSKEVWYYMMLIQLCLGVLMIFVGRISNKEWQNPVPCIEQPEELSNQFSFANSVWLIIGSVMQQGSEIAPIALAPRMITSVWWFFTMVMVASYVGTLVAFLIVEKNVMPFETVQQLYEHKTITYGAKRLGSTRQFFEKSTNPIFQKMYQKMIKMNWLVEDNNKGVEAAENSPYAFFTESTSIEYYKERHCDLLQVGGLLDAKSYGIGMKKESPYKLYIDDALLKMKERGEIEKLKNLWWKEKRGGGECGEKQNEEQKQLSMKNMLGAFVVLGCGCLIGLFISVLDMLWGVFKRSVKYNVRNKLFERETTFKYELIEELKFALKFSGDIKPVKRPPKSKEGSAEALAEADGKDEVHSLRTLRSGRSTSTRRTCHSHSPHSRHSSLSVAFARRRKYS